MTRFPTPPISPSAELEEQQLASPAAQSAPKPNTLYVGIQSIISAIYAPRPFIRIPSAPLGRIAIVGAGVTGVSSAAHCVAHGFEVVLFEKKQVTGGVWNDVNSTYAVSLYASCRWLWCINHGLLCGDSMYRSLDHPEHFHSTLNPRSAKQKTDFLKSFYLPDDIIVPGLISTSSLQLNSWLYRFHPSVIWSGAFPKQAEILKQVGEVWERYGLQSRTRFNYDVQRVQRYTVSGKTAWSVNDGAEGLFDGLIVAIGTCAQPYERSWPAKAEYTGQLLHSSELDRMTARPDLVAVIGSGASAVEAAEQAIERGACMATVIARNDKWIIPRGLFPMGLIAGAPWGWSHRISRIYEKALKRFHYRDVAWVAPTPETGYGLDQSTPIVNDQFLQYIREGSANYIRGQIAGFVPEGVKVLPKGQIEPIVVKADVVIDATGFQRPSMSFLPSSLFPTGYELPTLYLTVFSMDDPTVLLTNSGYEDAIGTVGHFHIGIFTRILLMFLLEPELAPQPKDMRLWVDIVRYLKSDAPADAFSFFTYLELFMYIFVFHVVHPRRIRWAFFNYFGFGTLGHPSRNFQSNKTLVD